MARDKDTARHSYEYTHHCCESWDASGTYAAVAVQLLVLASDCSSRLQNPSHTAALASSPQIAFGRTEPRGRKHASVTLLGRGRTPLRLAAHHRRWCEPPAWSPLHTVRALRFCARKTNKSRRSALHAVRGLFSCIGNARARTHFRRRGSCVNRRIHAMLAGTPGPAPALPPAPPGGPNGQPVVPLRQQPGSTGPLILFEDAVVRLEHLIRHSQAGSLPLVSPMRCLQ